VLCADGRLEVVQSNEYYYLHIISLDGRGLAGHYVGPKASWVFPRGGGLAHGRSEGP